MARPRNQNPEPKAQPAAPAWLFEKSAWETAGPRAAETGFLTRTLRRVSEVFESEFYCERYAEKPMLLQGIDPRVKILVLLALMVFSAFAASIAVLVALAVIAFLYAKLSGLDGGDYLRRVWAYVPPVVFLFSLPGASSLFTGGAPLLTLLPPGAFGLKGGLYFSAAGIGMAFRLALRPGVSLSFAFLLLLTTRWSRVTGALSALRVPLLMISVLNMAYRYIFVLAELADNRIQARFLRTVGRLKTAENRRFMSRSAAYLFLRAHFLSEDIYDAMLCRGFTGRPVTAERFKAGAADLLFLVNNAVILILLIAGDHLF